MAAGSGKGSSAEADWAHNRLFGVTAPSARAQGEFCQCSQSQGLILGGAVWSHELDSVIPVGSFQLCILCDSISVIRVSMYVKEFLSIFLLILVWHYSCLDVYVANFVDYLLVWINFFPQCVGNHMYCILTFRF